MKQPQKLVRKAPWGPLPLDELTVGSVKALFRGDATDRQQKHLVHWLLFDVCRINDLSFRSESARETDFAEGMRFVAIQMVAASKVNAGLTAPEKPRPEKKKA